MYELTLTKEQMKLIEQLCDLGLKTGGLQNLNSVISVLNAIGKAVEVEEKKES